jgi:uncharacterized protein (TIGR00369 family)
MDEPEKPLFEQMRAVAGAMMETAPHAKALGLQVGDIEKGRVRGSAPFRPELVGDPQTGVIAGGVIIALLDHQSGMAVMAALDKPTSVATLDLRIDYMRPAAPGRGVQAMAHCYHVARSAAFVRGLAYEDNPDDPVAQVSGVFMLGANGVRGVGANLKPSRRKPAQ